jgi:hypothetical protein
MVIAMRKNTYNNILSNITNTINVPVDIKKNKQDISIYTFYLTFVVLVISQFLFLDKFTYLCADKEDTNFRPILKVLSIRSLTLF